jgi:hypothetical protein
MANIDVNDIIADPDLVDPMILVHRQACVDTLGSNRIKETAFTTWGIIQPASGKALQRLPEALRLANVRSFWVKGTIITDGNGQYPDILVYRGTRFQVQTVMDWSNYGEGWAEGTCIQEKPTL